MLAADAGEAVLAAGEAVLEAGVVGLDMGEPRSMTVPFFMILLKFAPNLEPNLMGIGVFFVLLGGLRARILTSICLSFTGFFSSAYLMGTPTCSCKDARAAAVSLSVVLFWPVETGAGVKKSSVIQNPATAVVMSASF